MGIWQSTHGTDNALSLINLALMTGHIGRKGTGLNPLRGQNNVQGTSDAGVMPWHYPGYQLVDDEKAAQKFEKAWHIEPGGLSRVRGLTTTEILSSVGPGGVHSLYIMGENPMMSEPNLNNTRREMEALEFIVAQDLFINESGAYADVFLPSAAFAEKDGTFTNTDRRVQRVRQAIPPRGQARHHHGGGDDRQPDQPGEHWTSTSLPRSRYLTGRRRAGARGHMPGLEFPALQLEDP